MLHLQLAHEPQAARPGAPRQALQVQDAALLAWLAIEGPSARHRLAALLWPMSDTDAARNSLRQRVHRLRHLLDLDVGRGRSVAVRPTPTIA